jgi:hypothetical protein
MGMDDSNHDVTGIPQSAVEIPDTIALPEPGFAIVGHNYQSYSLVNLVTY